MTPLLRALSHYGTMEIVNGKCNPIVASYFKEIHKKWDPEDPNGWSSAFVNWAAKTTGYSYSNDIKAKSWLKIGEGVLNLSPTIGDIAILWENNPADIKRVGFIVNINGDIIWILGGNQDTYVNITAYPLMKVLEVRRLIKID